MSTKSVMICPPAYTQYRHWTDRRTDRIGETISRSDARYKQLVCCRIGSRTRRIRSKQRTACCWP